MSGYTPYSFVPTGHRGAANMSMGRDFARRESVVSIPGLDGVLDANGPLAGPLDTRPQPFAFRVFTGGDNDAAYDLLAAQVAPGVPQRLVYQTDSGALWFTVGSNPRIQQTVTTANNWGAGGFVDFVVTWRIRPDWRPRFSETTDVFSPTPVFFAADNHETFGTRGRTVIASANQSFTIDATGVAGSTLPTLPDAGARFTFVGPLGGSLGFQVVNGSSRVRDASGALQSRSFIVPFKLNTGSDGCTVYLDSMAFQINGLAFRPTKPNYQRNYFQVEPGIVNVCAVVGLGASIATGGSITVDWVRKRA